ncbi:hypothetical protein Gasu2_54810 [Galdieria sulphuraria]|nr:hypothetical protein Gasu2_54810 [Galdieria sulphuraria]
MTEQIEHWLKGLEKQLEAAKACSDKHQAEEKAQDVLKKSSQVSRLLVSVLPEEVRHYWVGELERMEESVTQNGVCCSCCGRKLLQDEGILCSLGCREKFCNKTCLKRGLQEHRKRCLGDKKRKLRRLLEQNGIEW